MKAKLNFKNMARVSLWLGLGLVLVAIGFMSAFPGLIITVLPLLTLLLLPFAVLGVFLYAEGRSLNQPPRHTRINPWQPTEPPGTELTPEVELASLNARLAGLKTEEEELEYKIDLLKDSSPRGQG